MYLRRRATRLAAPIGVHAKMIAIKRYRFRVFTIKLRDVDLLVTNHGQSESTKARYLNPRVVPVLRSADGQCRILKFLPIASDTNNSLAQLRFHKDR